jgi:nitroreductase
VVSGKKRDELSKLLLKVAEADPTGKPDIPLPASWPPALEQRAKEHGARRFKALGIERENTEQRKEMNQRNFYFYGAPSVLFLFMERSLTAWSTFDMGLFAQTLCLAAHSFGLGTCLQASLTRYSDAIRDFLSISKEKLLVVGISIGYPDFDARLNSYHSTRIGLNDFVKWYE